MLNYKNGGARVDIDVRTFEFSLKIIQLVNLLPRTPAGITIANQIIRSGSSIGANVQEALGAHTKSEFIYNMNVGKKEARETRYWLNIILGSKILPEDLCKPTLDECEQLVAILTVIVKNSRIQKQTSNL